ncbi:MAG: hypothetical protein AAB796_01900 [Patescibacteria group bacterium]
MERILDILFGSPEKAKVLKVFFRNPEAFFSIEDIQKNTKLTKAKIQREITALLKIGAITKEVKIESILGLQKNKKPQKINVFKVNPAFPLSEELKNLVMKLVPLANKSIGDKIKNLGQVKLALVSGFFLNYPASRIDLLIVGDRMDRRKMSNFLSRVETETGKSIRYVVMSSDEFQYRVGMFDRFLKDILELPHQKLINKINL